MKLKGIVLAVILSLASIMMPFNVYADSYVSPSYVSTTERDKWQNAGGNVVNFSEDPLTGSTPSKLTFTFNDNYYGFVSFQPYSGSSVWNDSTVFIAGGVGYYNYRNSSSYNPKYIDGVKITYVNLFLPDSNVDLTQIIDILTAIEQDTTSLDTTTDSILTDLQSVLNQLMVSNGYLETLTKLRQYNMPIESWRANYEPLFSKSPKTYQNIQYWNYPVYDLITGQKLYEAWNYTTYTTIFIFGTSKNITEQNYTSYLDIIGDVTTTFSDILISRLGNYKFIKFEMLHNSNSGFEVRLLQPITDVIYIYLGSKGDNHISTDFALQWGLSNRLLDNLDIIANGTTQSNSAASDLESSNSQMADDMDDLATIESGYNQQFNNQLQSIDFTSPIQNNAGILPAANFVITIFNGLINNNPFSVLIIIVCILLIGKKVIGK